VEHSLPMKRADGLYTTVKHYDPEVKARMYNEFLTSNKDPSELAIEFNVPRHVIAAWVKEGGWLERKREVEKDLIKAYEDQYRQVLRENKLPVIRRHLKLGQQLEEAIGEVIEEELRSPSGKDGRVNDMKLKRMAEALVASSSVTAKAVGLADTIVQNIDAQNGGRVPLVAIGIGPQLPSERTNMPSIEVREVEYEGNP